MEHEIIGDKLSSFGLHIKDTEQDFAPPPPRQLTPLEGSHPGTSQTWLLLDLSQG